MRYLFRGKKVKNGEWIEGYYYQNTVGVDFIIDNDGVMHEIVSDTIGQSTGKKDKNEKMIFEGDVLSLIENHIDGQQSEFGTVEVCFGEYDDSEIEYGSAGIGWFVKGFHGYIRSNGKKDTYFIGLESKSEWSLCQCLKWEVTGTIHDEKG